jgi:hypothetical protein
MSGTEANVAGSISSIALRGALASSRQAARAPSSTAGACSASAARIVRGVKQNMPEFHT